MGYADLANPVWHSLVGAHRRFARERGDVRWYPPTIAPFIAVPHSQVVPDLDAAARAGLRSPAYFAGILPASLPKDWVFTSHSKVLQMMPARIEDADTDEDIQALHESDMTRMLVLAQTSFPDFFRERTAELGSYLGVFDGSNLVAMAGERMALDGLREISGVCTHPDFTGRGFARRLTGALLSRHRQSGLESFLHVNESNAAARGLYESMGFVVHARLDFGKVEPRPLASERP